LFKQQLDAFVQKIFPMMRDNVKKQITPMVANCIHTPRGASARSTTLARRGSNQDPAAGATPQLSRYWADILGVFDVLLQTVKEAHVPRVLVQALFRQLFSFVNVQLFNQLLLRRECCSFSNGEYVKTGLAQVSPRPPATAALLPIAAAAPCAAAAVPTLQRARTPPTRRRPSTSTPRCCAAPCPQLAPRPTPRTLAAPEPSPLMPQQAPPCAPAPQQAPNKPPPPP
jgi:hypothetical protein